MFNTLQTYLLHTLGGQGTLAESFRTYAKPSLLFICCGAEPQWADSHKLAVKGKVYFFEGGLLDLLLSLPGIFAAAALLHYDMASTRQPPKQHCPLQNITSAISVWIHSGGLCLSVKWERVKRQKRKARFKTDSSYIHRLGHPTVSLHFMSTQSSSDAFSEPFYSI